MTSDSITLIGNVTVTCTAIMDSSSRAGMKVIVFGVGPGYSGKEGIAMLAVPSALCVKVDQRTHVIQKCVEAGISSQI